MVFARYWLTEFVLDESGRKPLIKLHSTNRPIRTALDLELNKTLSDISADFSVQAINATYQNIRNFLFKGGASTSPMDLMRKVEPDDIGFLIWSNSTKDSVIHDNFFKVIFWS